MKRIHINRKKTLFSICLAVSLAAVVVIISKAIKAAKYKKYASI